MASGISRGTSEASGTYPALCLLLACIVVVGLAGCSRAKLPVPPDANPRVYFRDPLQLRLIVAVERGNAEGVAAAVKAGANVDKAGEEGIRPIMWALLKGNVEGFRCLLEHDANLLALFINPARVRHGLRTYTMAEYAAVDSNKGFLRAILEHGFDPNTVVQPARGETLLFGVVAARDHEGAAMLLEAGADANRRSRYDEVPLINAVALSDFKTANVLYEHGADPVFRKASGYSIIACLKGLGSRNVTPDQQSSFDRFVDAMVDRGLVTRQDIIEAGRPKPGTTPGVQIIEHRANSPIGRAIRGMDATERRANRRPASSE